MASRAARLIARLLDPVLRWRRRVLWQVDKETARTAEAVRKGLRRGGPVG